MDVGGEQEVATLFMRGWVQTYLQMIKLIKNTIATKPSE